MTRLPLLIRRLAQDTSAADPDLLAACARRRDADAFALLVRRHGPLVYGVCRRWLRQPADVEDAFQATFLVLIKRADTLNRPERLANWLHGVAIRTARNLRNRAIRRQLREGSGRNLNAIPARPGPDDDELWPLVDEELRRLPEKYRLPVILCHLQGFSRREAAARLRCPEGTLSVRLARALDMLRSRLVRRGVAPAVALSVLPAATDASVPPAVIQSTARLALSSPEVPARIASLSEGVLRVFVLNRFLRTTAAVLAVGLFGLGGAVAVRHATDLPSVCADDAAPAAKVAPPLVLTVHAAADGAKIDRIEVREGKDERVTVNSVATLQRYLKRVRADKTAADVLEIHAPAEAKYADVVDVIDACRTAGFAKVTLQSPKTNAVQFTPSVVHHPVQIQGLTTYQPITIMQPLNVVRFVDHGTVTLGGLKTLSYGHAKKLETGSDPAKVQAEWMADLKTFIETNAKSSEIPEAMLQLAQMCEFTDKDAEAKVWYAKLNELAPGGVSGAKARGSLKRLNSVGQPLDLSGPALVGGKRFHIRDLKDKIVIVYYWASWNAISCRGDLAKLKALRNAYVDKGLELVCINLDERATDATQFL